MPHMTTLLMKLAWLLSKFPDEIDSSGTVTFGINGYTLSTNSGDVIFMVDHAVYANGETVDPALTSESSGAKTVSATDDVANVFEWTETVSNLGWAAGDFVTLYLIRDGDNVSDTLTGRFRRRAVLY